MIETEIEIVGVLNNDEKIVPAEPMVEDGVLEFIVNAEVEGDELVL